MDPSGTTVSDDLSNPNSLENGKQLRKMENTTMAHNNNVDITPQPGHSAERANPNIKPTQQAGGEEDDSNLSSNGSDPSVRSLASSASKKGKWKLDANSKWRYGSSDSATSTAISSVCSSVVADEKKSDREQHVSPSRKRLADGSVKQPVYSASAPAISMANAAAEQPQPDTTQTQQTPPKKRRGRPPGKSTGRPPGRPPKEKPTPIAPTTRPRRASKISKLQPEVRPRSSIPARLPVDVFASQCIEAAYASRMDPFALHSGEHALLLDLLMSKEVTVYLNIRNAILRLWMQNPLCSVTSEEAAGCAKEGRFYGLAEVAYKWLVRNGYINFGCVEVPRDVEAIRSTKKNGKQKTVVVVGAGVSGLTAARQLEHLFAQESGRWTDVGEQPPKVIVIEGRRRIGGRVYSKQLRHQAPGSLPDHLRNTVEMGAMIVTGFEHGNPLDTIIRGQLALRYHLMHDALTIYDTDGKAVDENTDMLNTELYTDISDRAGDFRAAPQEANTLKGDEELITRCRDPAPDGFEHFQVEPLFNPLDNIKQNKPGAKRGRRRNAPPGTEKLTGRTRVIEGSNATQSAARAARTMGWQLRDGIAKNQSISLHKVAQSSKYPTLGSVMDEAIEQYQDLIQLTPKDMRLLNWHHANLEYANAAPVSSLSLSGHDQDTGNEFEGAHSEVIGGYTQVPRGLMNLPTKLDVRFDRVVDSIHFNENAYSESEYSTKVVCMDGEVFEADEVVMTTPLGVLKDDVIDFDPPLPSWKRGVVERMGFGLLNKVILVYDKPFWDDERDMFGLLNEAENKNSLDPDEYARTRGRFYLIWNASAICGRPALVALMAGNAAHDVETMDSTSLLAEINGRLRTVFPAEPIPAPNEVIVTRWKRDPFTRGTYSYVGPKTRAGDYDLMAEPVGNLHFAGEATCGTHPATVHGAFLSGLRVAAEVMEAMAGPINLPMPLVGPAPVKQEAPMRYPASTTSQAQTSNPSTNAAATTSTIKQDPDSITVAPAAPLAPPPPPPPAKKLAGPPKQSVCAGDDSFWVSTTTNSTSDLNHEASIVAAILSQIGDRPPKPARPGVNPFLLFTKDKWEECKAACGENHGRDAIRSTLGRWWKAATEEVKRPYLEQSQAAQEAADRVRREWGEAVERWDSEARRIRGEFVGGEEMGHGGGGLGVSRRRTNVSNNVVLDHA